MTEPSNPFASFKLKQQPIHQQIADYIEEMVVRTELKVGQQLPSERELATQFGVNRGSVRLAISLLQQRGLVETRLGSGTYITRMNSDVLGQFLERYVALGNSSHEDLLELRDFLEPGIAELAAKRATAEDLEMLKSLVDQIEQANNPDDLDLNIMADVSFHEALALVTHNDLIVAVMAGLHGAMKTWIRAQTEEDRGQILDAVHGHRVIYDAIASRDSELAKVAMRHHLTYPRRVWQRLRENRFSEVERASEVNESAD